MADESKRIEEEKKNKFLEKIKALGITSPGILALAYYPTETFAFLKAAKESGFEIPMMIFMGYGLWWIRKDVIRIFSGELKEMNVNMKYLGDSLIKSNEENAIRAKISDERHIEANEKFVKVTEEVKDLSQKVLSIETRMQGIVPAPSPKDLLDLADKVANEPPDLTPP